MASNSGIYSWTRNSLLLSKIHSTNRTIFSLQVPEVVNATKLLSTCLEVPRLTFTFNPGAHYRTLQKLTKFPNFLTIFFIGSLINVRPLTQYCIFSANNIMYAHQHNTFPHFLYDQSRLDPIVKGRVRNGQKIKLTKIAKLASGLECKGDIVPLASIVLTSDDIIDGEIVMESSSQDCKRPTQDPTSLIVQNLGVILTPKSQSIITHLKKS